MRLPIWESLWLLASAGSGVLARGWHTASPLATITPCPQAPSSIASSPITVTNQYQAVSTCEARTACVKWGRCKTRYLYSTYSFVSTVIPCLAASSTTTVTRTEQTVLISRSSHTVTNTQLPPYVLQTNGTTTTASTARTTHMTVVKEWSAEYKNIGPLALPGYSGSGLCESCNGPHGEERQVLEAVECRSGPRRATFCSRGVETWIYQPAPTSTKQILATCSSRATARSPGVYTFDFPQWAPPATLSVPARTITYTIGGRRPSVVTTTVTATKTVVPRYKWTAFVTRSCAHPTTWEIDVTVTETITYTVPPFVVPCPTYVWPLSSILVSLLCLWSSTSLTLMYALGLPLFPFLTVGAIGPSGRRQPRLLA